MKHKRRLGLKQALWLESRRLSDPVIRRITRRAKDVFRYPPGRRNNG